MAVWFNDILDLGIWKWIDRVLHMGLRKECLEVGDGNGRGLKTGGHETIELDHLWKD